MAKPTQTFDLVNLKSLQRCTSRGRLAAFDTQGLSVCSVSASQGGGPWATAVLTLKQSNDLHAPEDAWVALSGVSTITSSTKSTGQFSSGYRYVLPFVTTAEGSDSYITVSFSGKE